MSARASRKRPARAFAQSRPPRHARAGRYAVTPEPRTAGGAAQGFERVVTRATAPAMHRLCPETPKTLDCLLWQQLMQTGDEYCFCVCRERIREFFPEIYAAVWIHVFHGGCA